MVMAKGKNSRGRRGGKWQLEDARDFEKIFLLTCESVRTRAINGLQKAIRGNFGEFTGRERGMEVRCSRAVANGAGALTAMVVFVFINLGGPKNRGVTKAHLGCAGFCGRKRNPTRSLGRRGSLLHAPFVQRPWSDWSRKMEFGQV